MAELLVHARARLRSSSGRARSPRSASADVGETLLAVTAGLMERGGVAAATGRAITRASGVSPALINYRFGSLAGLFTALDERVAARLNEGAQAACADLPQPAEVCVAPPIAAAVLAVCLWRAGRPTARLAEVLLAENELSGRFGAVARAEAGALHRIVTAVTAQAAETPSHLLWLGVIRMATLCLTLAPGSVIASGLAYDLLARTEQRMSRVPVAGPVSAFRQAAEARGAVALGPPGAGFGAEVEGLDPRVLPTLVELLRENGPSAATHRAIAERAGVSVSSITRAFASRTDLMSEAYRAMYREALLTHASAIRDTTPVSPTAFVTRLTSATISDVAATERQLRALILEAAWFQGHPEIGLGIFARYGLNTEHILRAVTGLRPDVDRMDAFIQRAAMAGLAALRGQPEALQVPRALQAWLAALSAD